MPPVIQQNREPVGLCWEHLSLAGTRASTLSTPVHTGHGRSIATAQNFTRTLVATSVPGPRTSRPHHGARGGLCRAVRNHQPPEPQAAVAEPATDGDTRLGGKYTERNPRPSSKTTYSKPTGRGGRWPHLLLIGKSRPAPMFLVRRPSRIASTSTRRVGRTVAGPLWGGIRRRALQIHGWLPEGRKRNGRPTWCRQSTIKNKYAHALPESGPFVDPGVEARGEVTYLRCDFPRDVGSPLVYLESYI
ncbi:WD40 repeat-containing protein [Marssonina coronariae]|uniref:WD40 repeat-containing protein n=1 Tax=Diplocarpon coronariae TaxID=2795749 RepID=A0A218Z0I2_9HELO|nr:WD40 repeat-containing protein [Marssonina coronariae]